MKLSFLDRAIGFFSPAAAVRRGLQRDMLTRLTSGGYEGATSGRRTRPWRSSGGSSADAIIGMDGPELRSRMRELTRNNPHAAKAVSILTNYIVGDGIMPRAKTPNKALNKKIDKLFEAWTKTCDVERQLDFYGVQTLVVREMIEAGEMLVRRRTRLQGAKHNIPLVLQLIEADHLDANKDVSPSQDNPKIVQGIEFNARGAIAAYWLLPEHPGDSATALNMTPVRIPADSICHLYEKQRMQVRGVPWGSPVMTTLRDLSDYEDAELMRKKLEACFVGIVVNGDEDDLGAGLRMPPSMEGAGLPSDGDRGVYDGSGTLVERFEPGMFAYARGGKDIKFNSPAQTGDYADYKRSVLHTIAAGFRVPYELLTTDLSDVSFISGRLGMMEFQRFISAVQWQIVIPRFLDPVWQWFLEAAVAAGELKSTDVPVEWSTPKWSTLDPLNEAKADLLAIRAGLRSLPEVIAERGRNPDDLISEFKEMNDKLDEAEIILDSDPRNTTAAGLYQVDPVEVAKAKPAPAAPKKA